MPSLRMNSPCVFHLSKPGPATADVSRNEARFTNAGMMWLPETPSQPMIGTLVASTTAWATGQFIPDAYPVTIPADTPPGAYRLVVGLYDPQDGTHLIDARTGAGEVVLDQPVVVK